MSGLISRQETIAALKQQAEEMFHWSERYKEQRKGILTAINVVSDVPSAEPERKRGTWKKYGSTDLRKCSIFRKENNMKSKIKWHDASKRLPKYQEGKYMAITRKGVLYPEISYYYGLWNASRSSQIYAFDEGDVIAWAKMPKAKKIIKKLKKNAPN